MSLKLNLNFIATCFLLVTSPVMAVNSNDANDDYFKSLELIKKPTIDSRPISASDIEEKKRVLELMRQSSINDIEEPKLAENGKIYDKWNEQIEIYKGDFSNEGAIEYALISTGGTMHANIVHVYKLISGHLVNTNFNQIIVNNLIPGKDMGAFYMHVANPFAVVKNGKTYLRFMSYPFNRDYDKTKLELCTYLWAGKKISLVGPNFTFNEKGNLIEAKDCIGSGVNKGSGV